MIEKKDGSLVAHVPKSIELQVKKLAEREGFSPSEYVTRLIMTDLDLKRKDFEFMKSLFDPDQ